MNRAVGFIVAAFVVGSGCGDNAGSQGMSQAQLMAKLRALDGVMVEAADADLDGLSYYILHFTQPIDHENPGLGTFQQRVSLLHRSEIAPTPMIVHTSGYADVYGDVPVELTNLLTANQVSIEHRFYGSSRPVPTDWTKLTIAQMAADEQAIIHALRTVYEGAFLTTGVSKGGMTAVFHRRFFPGDEVAGTIAYAAPISFDAPDTRYPEFLEHVGTEPCRRAVRELAIEVLANRRDRLEAFALQQPGNTYTRIAIGPAVESAVAGFEWAFWQHQGVDQCDKVPTTAASDKDVFEFLNTVSSIAVYSDRELADLEAYYYQSYAQLGYPDYSTPYLAPYLRYNDADYAGELPTMVEPPYDSIPMRDVVNFLEVNGDRLLLVYGQWDPWTAGRFPLGEAADSRDFVQPEGTHASHLTKLKQDDCKAALAMIESWTGVKPKATWWRRAAAPGTVQPVVPAPRTPPVRVRTPVARR